MCSPLHTYCITTNSAPNFADTFPTVDTALPAVAIATQQLVADLVCVRSYPLLSPLVYGFPHALVHKTACVLDYYD